MFAAISAFFYMAYCYFFAAPKASNTYSGKPRLGAAHVEESDDGMQSTFSGISVFIWGLVLAKAKQGMTAASTKDSSSVGGLLKKSAGLIFLIVVASVCQLMSSKTVPETVQHVVKQNLHLQSGHGEEHSDSYYDKSSSHYMGGAHNVALANIRKGLVPKSEASETEHTESYYDESSSHYMGGAHNVALQAMR